MRTRTLTVLWLWFMLSAICNLDAQPNAPTLGGTPVDQGGQNAQPAAPGRGAAPPQPFRLISPAFADVATIPARYTCEAGASAISPPLRWLNAPSAREMVTFALIMHDIEPRPQKGVDDILHWMVWNIPAVSTGFPEGISAASTDLPDGSMQGNGNSDQGGIVGYQPPCPPQSVALPHHYVFELFALDTRIDLPEKAKRADLLKAIDGHVLAHASMIGVFNR